MTKRASGTATPRTALRRYALIFPPLAYLLVFFFLPLILMIVISVWREENYQLIPTFTLENYHEAITAPLNAQTLLRTVYLSTIVVLVSVAIGYPGAFYLARRVRNYRHVLVVLVMLPLWTSYLIRTFAWIPVLSRNGVLNQALIGLGITDRPIEWFIYSPFAVVVALAGIYMPR